VADADFVYTDVWVSMGFEEEAKDRLAVMAPYQVNETLLEQATSDVKVLHCLPAYRGKEITAEVLDGPRSLVWDQAENRLHAQKAVLTALIR
jgi:ornithine carbamoyltransferase